MGGVDSTWVEFVVGGVSFETGVAPPVGSVLPSAIIAAISCKSASL